MGTSGEPYLRAAYSYLYIRDFDRAMDAFQKAIECEPDNPDYCFRGSVTALRNGRFDIAQDWAKQAVALSPTDRLYEEHLAVVISAVLARDAQEILAAGDADEARALLEQALERDPLNTEAARQLIELNQVEETPHLTN